MKYFILTSTEDGWDCVRGLYQAESEDDVRNYIEEQFLEKTNDPEKAEKDRNDYWDRNVLTEKSLTIVV